MNCCGPVGGFFSTCKNLMREDIWHLWERDAFIFKVQAEQVCPAEAGNFNFCAAIKSKLICIASSHLWKPNSHESQYVVCSFLWTQPPNTKIQTQKQRGGGGVSLLWWTGADTARCLVKIQISNVGSGEELTCALGPLSSQVLCCSRLVSLQADCMCAVSDVIYIQLTVPVACVCVRVCVCMEGG